MRHVRPVRAVDRTPFVRVFGEARLGVHWSPWADDARVPPGRRGPGRAPRAGARRSTGRLGCPDGGCLHTAKCRCAGQI